MPNLQLYILTTLFALIAAGPIAFYSMLIF